MGLGRARGRQLGIDGGLVIQKARPMGGWWSVDANTIDPRARRANAQSLAITASLLKLTPLSECRDAALWNRIDSRRPSNL